MRRGLGRRERRVTAGRARGRPVGRALGAALAALATLALGAGPALACAGLIGPGGTVQLARTTTLAAYHDGIEHYVTAFSYQGGGAKFGSIVPLPGVPTKVEKAGDWTLQRLLRETQPQEAKAAFQVDSMAAGAPAEVLQEVKVDALDLTVLRGGGKAVGDWARQNGFSLTPDAPEILDFYASRSQIFMAAVYDPTRAADRGQRIGDGTPVHLTIPTDGPWVPLRILGLGLEPDERVQADVFLLTEREPLILPKPAAGMSLSHSQPASRQLLEDLRSDRGMSWLPSSGMWLSQLQLDIPAGRLKHDLAVDANGNAAPSRVDAGLDLPISASDPVAGGSGGASAGGPAGGAGGGGLPAALAWLAGGAVIGVGAAALLLSRSRASRP
jgi:Uncharacterized protein conserved in bacteria (DUF2330)